MDKRMEVLNFMKYKPIVVVLSITTTNGILSIMTTNEKQRVTLFINPDLLKQAKAQAIIEEMSLTELVERALTKYLPKETIIKKAEILKRKVVKTYDRNY